jgi:hypothetical protein
MSYSSSAGGSVTEPSGGVSVTGVPTSGRSMSTGSGSNSPGVGGASLAVFGERVGRHAELRVGVAVLARVAVRVGLDVPGRCHVVAERGRAPQRLADALGVRVELDDLLLDDRRLLDDLALAGRVALGRRAGSLTGGGADSVPVSGGGVSGPGAGGVSAGGGVVSGAGASAPGGVGCGSSPGGVGSVPIVTSSGSLISSAAYPPDKRV